jgi:hypothetical protein
LSRGYGHTRGNLLESGCLLGGDLPPSRHAGQGSGDRRKGQNDGRNIRRRKQGKGLRQYSEDPEKGLTFFLRKSTVLIRVTFS